jgi:glycine hydroxymethyltransferase
MYLSNSFEKIKRFDPEMAALVENEEKRQLASLCLIASENYASPLAVGLEGSVYANKNAEGYPGKRFVAGCELADRVENLAIERIKKVFGCEHVNVQVMSATVGNVAILRALLKSGDTILSMELNQGGHLSHGAGFHLSGQDYKVVQYGLNRETETIDIEQVERLALEHKPRLIICGASSYPRQIDYKRFGEIAKKAGAYLMADIAHPVGLIAAGVIPSPVPHADVISTSTHKTWRGPRGGGIIMCTAELAQKIDYHVFPGLQGAPKMDLIAARAVLALESLSDEFRAYQQQVYENAQALADELRKCGLRLVSGGTDTHLILVDVRSFIASGKEAERRLESVGLIVNKNMIPYDPQSPQVTSGIRIGSPALTTRGLMEDDFRVAARLLADALKAGSDQGVLAEIKARVSEMAARYPMFADKWMAKPKRG